MTFLVLVIVASTLFVAAANAARPNPGVQMPVNTGFAGQGQFRQGMQTGAQGQGFGQGPATGIAAPPTNFPGQIGPGQQGVGIVAGDRPGSSSTTGPIGGGTIGQGGPGTCYCITAPCNCGGTSGNTGTITGAQLPTGGIQLPPGGGQLPTGGQAYLNQPYQGQFTQPQTVPAGNAGSIQPRQF